MVFISNNYDIPDYFNCDTRINDSQGILDDDHVDVAGVLPDVVHNKQRLLSNILLVEEQSFVDGVNLNWRCSEVSRLLLVSDGGNFMVAPPGATGLFTPTI